MGVLPGLLNPYPINATYCMILIYVYYQVLYCTLSLDTLHQNTFLQF